MTHRDRNAGKNEQGQRVAEPPCQACLTISPISVRRAAIEETAAIWSASSACCIPSRKPNPRIPNISPLLRTPPSSAGSKEGLALWREHLRDTHCENRAPNRGRSRSLRRNVAAFGTSRRLGSTFITYV